MTGINAIYRPQEAVHNLPASLHYSRKGTVYARRVSQESMAILSTKFEFQQRLEDWSSFKVCSLVIKLGRMPHYILRNDICVREQYLGQC